MNKNKKQLESLNSYCTTARRRVDYNSTNICMNRRTWCLFKYQNGYFKHDLQIRDIKNVKTDALTRFFDTNHKKYVMIFKISYLTFPHRKSAKMNLEKFQMRHCTETSVDWGISNPPVSHKQG